MLFSICQFHATPTDLFPPTTRTLWGLWDRKGERLGMMLWYEVYSNAAVSTKCVGKSLRNRNSMRWKFAPAMLERACVLFSGLPPNWIKNSFPHKLLCNVGPWNFSPQIKFATFIINCPTPICRQYECRYNSACTGKIPTRNHWIWRTDPRTYVDKL